MIAALPLITSAASSLLSSAPAATSTLGAATQALQALKPAGAAAAQGTDFSAMVAQLSSDAVGKLNKSEQMSIAGLNGKATTQSVVEAVMSAQEALQTAVAVRDKAVGAFQEVTRMSI